MSAGYSLWITDFGGSFFYISKSFSLKKKYRPFLQDSNTKSVVLNATCTSIELSGLFAEVRIILRNLNFFVKYYTHNNTDK